jgi:very-short-patch-repair endonuclease
VQWLHVGAAAMSDNEDVTLAEAEPVSVFQSDLPIDAKLDRARTELLDLSARNRLLNIPRSAKSAKTLEIVDERGSEVFRVLVRDGKAFTFVAGKGELIEGEGSEEELVDLVQPGDDGVDARGVANRHSDTRLQTRLTPAGLQKKLLDLYYDARTLEEEQGVNILFLAIGTLKWIDPNNATALRYAPLILVPVELERGNAAEKFKLRARQEDVAANLSLEAYLDRIHSLKLPTFEAGDDFDPSDYALAVADAVSAKPGWSVDVNDLVLGFFSFAKFLMYRDLDPQSWPANAKLSDHSLLKPLMTDGFPEGEPLMDEDLSVDAHVSPSQMVHIVDSDSSQTLAIEEVRRGRNLVIQGPPGTGKSQTIANVIAAAVADGKRVLFVAEKMAALDVVKRRLDSTGVGDACLELHSNKANKRAVLEELRRTWELGAPRTDNLAALNARLTDVRDDLNAHAERLHRHLGGAGFTPYDVVGHLVRLRRDGVKPAYLKLEEPESWSREDFEQRSRLVAELADRVLDLGEPGRHLWRGIELDRALPPEVARIEARLSDLFGQLAQLRAEQDELVTLLEMGGSHALGDLEGVLKLAVRISTAPDIASGALAADIWERLNEVRSLVEAGANLEALRVSLSQKFTENAWDTDVEEIAETLEPLDPKTVVAAFDRARSLADRLPNVRDVATKLAKAIGRESAPHSLSELETMAQVGDRVSVAPEADASAFAQDLWGSGVERAADLATAVKSLEDAQSQIGSAFSDSAWSADLSDARRSLAAHGASLFRIFNSEWRSADKLVRSYLSDPKAPLQRRLGWLDALARGQAAQKSIRDEDEFGRSAFGSDWRAERSSSVPLLALVEWMRSLKGLGAEPRLVVGRKPDRSRVGELSRGLTTQLQAARTELTDLWEYLGSARSVVFDEVSSADEANLHAVGEAASCLAKAHTGYGRITVTEETSLVARRQNLSDLMRGQVARADIQAQEGVGRDAFGDQWNSDKSDWVALSAIANWIQANGDIRILASRVSERQGLPSRCEAILTARDNWRELLSALLSVLKATSEAAITAENVLTLVSSETSTRLAAWRDGGEALTVWVGYRARAHEANVVGLKDLVDRLHSGDLAPVSALPDFEQAFFESVFESQVEAEPALATFDGELHSRKVSDFAALDRQRIKAAAMQVALNHHRRVPPKAGGAVGPLGVLKGEIARKRGHMPIRQLMQKAAQPIQALKPVFMMSPLSVAQFLPPGALEFDLLVMDEASQIQPVDALGAIARCKQVVVVGDPQQLPPTAFFAKMTGQTDNDDDDGPARVADIESILGLFTARGLPMRMLRWHYRSRHESLIAVSNKQFYENKLVIIPSPYTARSGLGLRFHHIKDGIFESGTTRTNPVEAQNVAAAIIHHATTSPKHSLGVVAFSSAQRKAIIEQLELLRRQLSPEVEAFFQAHPSEPFFVKNLENVQGDERDVIFISIGYGPTTLGGKPPMRFGPVGQEGGERRLNVLISRAKRRCEVFASMTDEDIDPDFASPRKGVFALKLFMHFARTGRISLAESVGRDADGVFEEQVASALHERGYQVHRDVGISGLFIDIAVADPDHPDRYILAIECDGPSYQKARSARDRDRLRRSVLESQGWFVHRIWSGDWFNRPQEQLERVVAAIEAAKGELAREEQTKSRLPAYEFISVQRESVTEMGIAGVEEDQTLSVPYVEAGLIKPSHLTVEIHEAPTGILSQLSEQVVATEGPVHFDEIVARIRDAWGRGRAGGRIREAVRRALDVSVRHGRVLKAEDFYSYPGGGVAVRDRSAAMSPSLRRPEMFPPAEIETALLSTVSRNFGATEDQAVQAVARAFGVKSTSAQLKDLIVEVMTTAISRGILVRRDTLIDVGPNAPKLDREPRILGVELLVAQGEGEQLEFKETLRWDVRQGALNKRLEDQCLKAIAAFTNYKGGALLIGVRDDGSVPGLEPDLATFGGSRDKFDLHLTSLTKDRFSESFRAGCVSVSYPTVQNKLICRVDVKRSRKPVYLAIADGSGAAADRLIVRAGSSSPEIPLSQVAAYVREHFDT